MTGKFHPKAVVFDKDGVLADSEWINVRSELDAQIESLGELAALPG